MAWKPGAEAFFRPTSGRLARMLELHRAVWDGTR